MIFVLACASPPIANIVATTTDGPLPLTVDFRAENLADGPELAGFAWDIDGTEAEGATLTHTFLASGVHTVGVTVTDTEGNTSDARIEITVSPESCPESGEPETTGTTDDAVINETSGVVESRDNPGVLWVHNDSGDDPVLYALSTEGALRSAWELEDARPGDWEDLAIGVDPETGGGLLYVGDIGDNSQVRDAVTVYRVPEPVVIDTDELQQLPWDAVTLTYPDGPQNAETLLLDPATDDLYIVTKDYGGATGIYRKAAPHLDGEEAVLERVGELDFSAEPLSGGATTGGDISPLGNRIVVRTYGTAAYVWLRDGAGTVADAFATPPCPITLPGEQQGEALGFSVDGASLWSISEGTSQPVHLTPLQ